MQQRQQRRTRSPPGGAAWARAASASASPAGGAAGPCPASALMTAASGSGAAPSAPLSSAGGGGGDDRALPQHDGLVAACTASSSRWVETRTADPASRSSRITLHASPRRRAGRRRRTARRAAAPSGWWKAASTHRHPAAHAVREAGGDAVGGAAEVEAVEQVLGPPLPAGGQPAQRGRQLEVLPRRGAGDQPADVRAVADPRLDPLAGRRRTSTPATRTVAGGRRQHAREHPQGGRLAGAVAPDQGHRRRRRARSGRALHGDDGAEQHTEVADLDDGRHPDILAHDPARGRIR